MYSKEELYLIDLVKCVLNQKKAIYKKDIDYNFVYALALYHGIANMVYYAIDDFKNQIDENLAIEWLNTREKEIVKDITQEVELGQIEKEFNKNKIRYVLLKGALLKKLYPSKDMRTMGDIDILIDKKNQEKTKDLMEKMGYTTQIYNKSNEDVYYKVPIMNIEIHTELFNKKSSYYHFYENIEELLIKDDNYKFKFSDEDFYIFLIVHMAKHYFYSGIGVRSVIDIYLYNKKRKLDRNYIEKKLKQFELFDFEKDILKLIDSWFNDKQPDDETLKMGIYILESGKYGKQDNIVNNRMEEYKSKNKYLLKRIFLNKKEMKKHYPILNKTIILLPFFWIYRLLSAIITKPKNIIKEIKQLINYKH